MQSPHDALFKATFSKLRHAHPMLREALSAAARRSALRLVPSNFVDEQLEDRRSDLSPEQLAELDVRLDDLDAGRTKLLDGDEVLAELRTRAASIAR